MAEDFLTAHVSQDCRIIGLEHPTDADWNEVRAALIALRNHLTWRIDNARLCPYTKGENHD